MPRIAVIVVARNEADRLGETLAGVAQAFPGAPVLVADDASTDATPAVARARGAEVVSSRRRLGKGGVATLAARTLLARDMAAVVVICDGDLGRSAALLAALTEALEGDSADLAVAAFARRLGGGFGLALGVAGRGIEALTGLRPAAPLSGQRAMRVEVLRAVLPFAAGFGMETAMTIDALDAGYRLREVELDLEHRATGRTPAGFVHRARQLRDIALALAVRSRRTRRAVASARRDRLAAGNEGAADG